ncbi:chymotrypsin-1-like [Photinus pyralis]|uniref:chymotrypsin-1-like n=1 Tax=Photinus pyralis TaxID=7054 RepID=UPI001266FA14|nr:chymotrypsin-1-like [Photinus pyralis]
MNACLLLLFVTGTLGAVSPLNYLFGTVPKDEYDWKIVGGSDAPEGAYPYQVSLRSFGSHNCGGSIIDATTVMTAAHCVTGSSPSFLRVVVGSNKLNSGGVTYEIESIRAHTGFDSWRLINDIAILKLKTPITFTDKVKAVDLETEYLGAEVDCVLSGWGRLNYPGSLPNNLQHIDLKTITSEDCAKLLNHNSVDRTHICTLTKAGEGACHGDSGGPLVANKQIGIVSFGRPCAKGYPDAFTRVSAFTDWIEKNRY